MLMLDSPFTPPWMPRATEISATAVTQMMTMIRASSVFGTP